VGGEAFETGANGLREPEASQQSEALRDVAPSDPTPVAGRDPACFTARRNDSSGNVLGKRAERTHAYDGAGAPLTDASMSADEALRLATKLAVDAGDYERAEALLKVLKR
jgi:hypothetical protein